MPTGKKRKRTVATKTLVQRLPNPKLLKLAAKHRPPQSWFDQSDVPFTPAKD